MGPANEREVSGWAWLMKREVVEWAQPTKERCEGGPSQLKRGVGVVLANEREVWGWA